MLERKLQKLIKEAKEIRRININNGSASYCYDVFDNLSNFILKKLNKSLFKNKNFKIIANYFDEILPYIVMSNIDILFLNIDLLIEQPNFKEKFIEGLNKYPYKDELGQMIYVIWTSLNDDSNTFDTFMKGEVLTAISTMNLDRRNYSNILNKLNKENQRDFLNLLIENKCDVSYAAIEYKGSNKQIIYDNVSLFAENSKNLYALLNFVKDDSVASSQVKEYIDNNEEKAINSIFCETEHLIKINNPTLKEIIKLIVLEVKENEKVNLSDIIYDGGGFSRILLIGNKVIKLGNRATKRFPNNPYIIAPLLRKEFVFDDEACFIEITERVDTSIKPSKEELFQLFKNLRDLGLIWTDIKTRNVGRLKKENIIHWKESLDPTEEVLGFDGKRGNTILKEGDLVVLDADFIYDEKDPNINYVNNKELFDEFEERYKSEKKKLKEHAKIKDLKKHKEEKRDNFDINENKGIRR